ncbi:hypothetical protein L227DRAFT_389352 [Lentinus tigrinus ALCF2SS1-6]|uniref:Uncharacterized protein n=1 Tax=Lentinus tigrinus ALCF2SS1-6 TaxID=1328759 RepID=A0A5C2SJT3_9APHY|nr:hypothetical protein L227DRAFT_389352 [Lentinus tigrinus ALCF2SS1-6]
MGDSWDVLAPNGPLSGVSCLASRTRRGASAVRARASVLIGPNTLARGAQRPQSGGIAVRHHWLQASMYDIWCGEVGRRAVHGPLARRSCGVPLHVLPWRPFGTSSGRDRMEDADTAALPRRTSRKLPSRLSFPRVLNTPSHPCIRGSRPSKTAPTPT